MDNNSFVINNNELKAKVAYRLYNERKNSGYSQETIAASLYVSRQTVSKWESKDGAYNNSIILPSLDQLISLASIYKCDVGYLLCLYDSRTYAGTDIFREIGIDNNTVTFLQSIFNTLFIPQYEDYNNFIFFAFINYFLLHSQKLNKFLADKSIYAEQRCLLATEKDRIIIEDCLAFLSSHKPDYSKGDYVTEKIIKLMAFEDSKKYYTTKYPLFETNRINELAEATIKYHKLIYSEDEKITDFSLSDTFLDITKNFFTNYFSLKENYRKTLSAIYDDKAQHLSETIHTIDSSTIVRANKNRVETEE